jgi:MFS family permease
MTALAREASLDTDVAPLALAKLDPRRWWILPVVLIGSFLSFLDFFIVTIALPAMQADLGAHPSQLQFVVAAYGIGFGVFLITGGRLGDIYGRKRVLLLGLAGFTVASTICGLASSAVLLIAARVVQAICAAAVTPQVLAIIRVEFADGERAVAIGWYGASMGFASIVAQLVGGFLISWNVFGWSWRLIFLINLPVGFLAIVLVWLLVRDSRNPRPATLDLGGVALASLALFLLIYPTVEGREAGWPMWSFAMFLATVPVLVGFVLFERRVIAAGRTPLIALHLLQIHSLRLGLAISIAFFSTAGVFFVVLTMFFQNGLGFSASATGLMFLPFAIGFSASSILSGQVANRIGPRTIIVGCLLMALSLFAIIMVTLYSGAEPEAAAVATGLMVPVFLVYGLGQGLAQPTLINTVVGASGVTGDDVGSAVGLFLTTAQSFVAFGVAAIGDVFFSFLSRSSGPGSYMTALIAALTCNLILQVACVLLACGLLRRAVHAGKHQAA